MAELNEFANVVITTTPQAVSQRGFGVGLGLAKHLASTSRYLVYASLAEVAEVFPDGTDIYAAAEAYFAQEPNPESFAVGRRQVDVATVAITAVFTTLYRVTINGVNFDYTSDGDDTAEDIETALISAINGGSEPVTASSGGTGVLTLTQDVAGTAWTLAVNGNMAVTLAAADTIAEDLAAIAIENPNFYGVGLVDARASADAQALAAWVQANKRIAIVATQEANVIGTSDASDTTTLPAILKAAGYTRTATIYLADISSFPDFAVLGRILPYSPGSYTAMYKTLTGITVSSLTSTQATNAKDKNVLIYESAGGRSFMREGKMASGVFIDQIHARDWLISRIEEAVFALLSDSSLPKVPFTDGGISLMENAVKGVLEVAKAAPFNYLSSYTTTAPLASAVSSANRGNRLLPDIRFTATEQGAIHKASPITGVVSV